MQLNDTSSECCPASITAFVQTESPLLNSPGRTVTLKTSSGPSVILDCAPNHRDEVINQVQEKIRSIRELLYDQKREVYHMREELRSELDNQQSLIISKATEILIRDSQDLKDQLSAEINLRRRLHNTIQDMKGNIRVYVRVRPILIQEKEKGISEIVKVESDSELVVNRNKQPRGFTFDRVFSPNTDENALFAELQQLLVSSLDGFNVAIIAYGITGSGKTFTMNGIYDRLGIDLFENKIARQHSGWQYCFELSVFEVYNESIIDLLNLHNLDTNIRLDTSTGFFHIPGITKKQLTSTSEFRRYITEAGQNRSVSSTNCNEQSSRSHQITSVMINVTTPVGQSLSAKMSLVDLAGSERAEKSGAVGQSAKEGICINKSLSALGDVLNARASRSSHIPYRNSILTSVLQHALSGDSKTVLLLQVNPSSDSLEETYNSLVFANRVRDVESIRNNSSPRRK